MRPQETSNQAIMKGKLTNQCSGTIARWRREADQTLAIIMKAIAPLTEQEFKLQRMIALMEREQGVLTNYLESHREIQEVNLERIKQFYHEEIANLIIGFHEVQKEFLKSRSHIFDNQSENFFEVTEKKLSELMGKFHQLVEIDRDICEKNFLEKIEMFTSISDIQNHCLLLSIQLDDLYDKLGNLVEKKTPLGVKHNEAEEALMNRIRKLRDRKETIEESFDNSVASLSFQGNLEGVKKHIESNNLNINKCNMLGELPLHRACEGGQMEVIEYLLLQGADPCTLDQKPHMLEKFSAYHYACMQDNLRVLIQLFPKRNYQNITIRSHQKRTLLHTAVFSNQLPVVAWLLNKERIDINANDSFTGATPLHLAAWKGCADIANYLLQCGADPKAKNHAKDTPITMALLYRQTEVLKVFFRSGYCLSQDEISRFFSKKNGEIPPDSRYLFARCLEEAYLDYALSYRKLLVPQSSTPQSPRLFTTPKREEEGTNGVAEQAASVPAHSPELGD